MQNHSDARKTFIAKSLAKGCSLNKFARRGLRRDSSCAHPKSSLAKAEGTAAQQWQLRPLLPTTPNVAQRFCCRATIIKIRSPLMQGPVETQKQPHLLKLKELHSWPWGVSTTSRLCTGRPKSAGPVSLPRRVMPCRLEKP